MLKKNMLIKILLVFFLIFNLGHILNTRAKAVEEPSTYKLQLKILNKTEDYKLYVLLPESYLDYALEQSGIITQDKGIDLLKNNEIPGIKIEKQNIQENVYKENEIEYVQILLTPDQNETYHFDVIESYKNMDIKFRLTSNSADNIMHLNNFEVQDKVCKMEYDFKEGTFKNIIKKQRKIAWWQIVIGM